MKYRVEFPVITYLSITVDADSKVEAIKIAEQSPYLINVEHAGGEPRIVEKDGDINSEQA